MNSLNNTKNHGERGSAAWKWLVSLVVLMGAAFVLLRQCNKQPMEQLQNTATETVTQVTENVGSTANSMWAALGDFFKRALPNGIELNIPKLGVENRLIDFIEDKTKPVDKTTWFDFDRLLFDTGKATLQPESNEQLNNIAEILKAYPNVKIKVGGYTDNVGDKTMNLQLSSDRAKNVMGELVKLGVDATRLAAEGYGDQHPVAENTTEEGRAKNRRISMRVTAK